MGNYIYVGRNPTNERRSQKLFKAKPNEPIFSDLTEFRFIILPTLDFFTVFFWIGCYYLIRQSNQAWLGYCFPYTGTLDFSTHPPFLHIVKIPAIIFSVSYHHTQVEQCQAAVP